MRKLNRIFVIITIESPILMSGTVCCTVGKIAVVHSVKHELKTLFLLWKDILGKRI